MYIHRTVALIKNSPVRAKAQFVNNCLKYPQVKLNLSMRSIDTFRHT